MKNYCKNCWWFRQKQIESDIKVNLIYDVPARNNYICISPNNIKRMTSYLRYVLYLQHHPATKNKNNDCQDFEMIPERFLTEVL